VLTNGLYITRSVPSRPKVKGHCRTLTECHILSVTSNHRRGAPMTGNAEIGNRKSLLGLAYDVHMYFTVLTHVPNANDIH